MSEQHEFILVELGNCSEQPGPVGSICIEESFRLRRPYAEERGSRWFVLSAHHGVLAPEEWVSPPSEVQGLVPGRHKARVGPVKCCSAGPTAAGRGAES